LAPEVVDELARARLAGVSRPALTSTVSAKAFTRL